MLTTSVIIDLYNNNDLDTIISALNMPESPRAKPLQIFSYAIENNNTDLVAYMLLNNSDWVNIFMEWLISNEFYYGILETILKNNPELCTIICTTDTYSTLELFKIPKNNNIALLNIVILYLSSDDIIIPLLSDAINFNNLPMIDILANAGFDVKLAFDTFVTDGSDIYSLTYHTCIWLQKYNIDLLEHTDRLAELFCEVNDVPGLIFFLGMGADINCAIGSIYNPSLEIVKCIIDHGIDINWFNKYKIENIIKFNSDNLNIITYLVDMGLDMSNYIPDLMFVTIGYEQIHILKFFMELGTNIHFDDELLLFYSAYNGRAPAVEFLLENGADVHVKNDSILLFEKSKIPQYILDKYDVRYITPSLQNRYVIDKLLIKYGAITDDYKYIFCRYIRYIKSNLIDMEYLTYLLDKHIDLNTKFNDDMFQSLHEFYIFEAVICYSPIEIIKLCIAYEVDPFINNHGPLRVGIRHNRVNAVKILLDMGSRTNIELECNMNLDMINLLDEYQINYEVKKIDQ
jgi:hypothetical protein